MFFFVLNFFLVAALSFGQLNHFLIWGGLQTNFALTSILAFSFFEKDWLRRAVLIFLAVFILNFEPYFGLHAIIIATTFFLSVFLLDTLGWEPAFNLACAVLIGTLLINIDALRLIATSKEMLLNLFSVTMLTFLMGLLVPKLKR